MLYQLSYSRLLSSKRVFISPPVPKPKPCFLWGEQDSNLRRYSPADLQSAPVGRFGISPKNRINSYDSHSQSLQEPMKGFEPPTCRLQISCSGQLSYIGNLKNAPTGHNSPLKIGLQMYEFIFLINKLILNNFTNRNITPLSSFLCAW